MADDRKQFMVEDARIIPAFRNFSGKEGPYNNAGSRNFAVELDPQVANAMKADGWNVKFPTPGEDDEDTKMPYIQVSIGWKVRPPTVVMVSATARTIINEKNVEMLDWVNITKADLIAVESRWTHGQRSGIKPYVQTLVVFIEEDALQRKYAHLLAPDATPDAEETNGE